MLPAQRVITAEKRSFTISQPNFSSATAAEKLIPACDISEQISLASKEASGTGNMKFMLNGAVTLGTMDGANVEIAQLVGKDWFMTFPDFADYCRVKAEAIKAYGDEKRWGRMTLANIANAGFFSSDRTIKQYNDDIWHLG